MGYFKMAIKRSVLDGTIHKIATRHWVLQSWTKRKKKWLGHRPAIKATLSLGEGE